MWGRSKEEKIREEMRKGQKRNECSKAETRSECPGKGCDED